MQNPLLVLIFLITSIQSQAAQAELLEYKSWKTFESNYGFAFKYPVCWKVEIADAYYEGPLHETSDLLASEGLCKTKRLDPELHNGVSFGASITKIDKVERKKQIDNLTNLLLRPTSHLAKTKKKTEGGAEMFLYVEQTNKLKNTIRWSAHLYCPERVIELQGPTIKDPDKALLEKFKKGDLAIPEPYKTIYDSVKCTRDKK